MFPTGSALLDGDGDVRGDVLEQARDLLAGCVPAGSSTAMFDQISALEGLRGLVAAVQAEVTAAFTAARCAEQLAGGMPQRRVGAGVAQEVGRATRQSPSRAEKFCGFATVLTTELPCTFAALRAGETSEWRATLMAWETGWLSRGDRATVDAALGPRLHSLGDKEVAAKAQELAYQLDPHGLVERFARAARSRTVTLRPAPEGMTRFSATLPLAQGVAAFAALHTAAVGAKAGGDPRGKGQVMADTLVERITGQTTADAVPLTVNLVMTDATLTRTGAGAEDPADIPGYGPIPAPVARDLIVRTATKPAGAAAEPATVPLAAPVAPTLPVAPAAATAAESEAGLVAIRRLFTDPLGHLVSMETGSRFFTPAQAEFIRLRDQTCITPFCGAPIRHIDHVNTHADGGPTSLVNAGGLCEACNYAKEAPGWTTTRAADGTITTTTPTGHPSSTHHRGKPWGTRAGRVAPSEAETLRTASGPPETAEPVGTAAPGAAMPPDARTPATARPVIGYRRYSNGRVDLVVPPHTTLPRPTRMPLSARRRPRHHMVTAPAFRGPRSGPHQAHGWHSPPRKPAVPRPSFDP